MMLDARIICMVTACLLLALIPPCVSACMKHETGGSPQQRVLYVYRGVGAGEKSVEMLMTSLIRAVPDDAYRVVAISPEEIIKGDWRQDAALISLGGGYDLGYLSGLGDEGMRHIREFVKAGGSYLGFCAGAYFAADYIEFDEGGPDEVVGERYLKFFPGKCIGPVFPGFEYNSEKGAHAAFVSWEAPGGQDIAPSPGNSANQNGFYSYFNGGGQFMPYGEEQFQEQLQLLWTTNMTVMSRYLEVEGHPIAAAWTEVDEGRAVVSGVHFEYIPDLLPADNPYLQDKLPKLKAGDEERKLFVKHILNTLSIATKP